MSRTDYRNSATRDPVSDSAGAPARKHVSVLQLTDPADAAKALPELNFDWVKLDTESIFVKRVVVDLDGCLMAYHFSSHPGRSRSQLAGPHWVVVTFSPSTTGTLDGREIKPDLLATAKTGSRPELVAGSDYRAILFLLPPDDVESHLASRGVGPDFLYGEIELVQSLYRWGRSVIRAAEQSPQLFEENEHIREGVRRELVERLGEALSSTRDLPPRDAELTRVNHSRLVKRTQDYVLENIDERIHLADLCHAMRISERTLRYAFRHVLGMSPVAYLSRLRLHRVHKSLKEANRQATTVTTEALQWGFWHVGDFSKAYKECFGELPSDTLAREP